MSTFFVLSSYAGCTKWQIREKSFLLKSDAVVRYLALNLVDEDYWLNSYAETTLFHLPFHERNEKHYMNVQTVLIGMGGMLQEK